jgi:hypothetical protein
MRPLSASAISRSRSFVACWQISAALGLDWPRRAISSFVLAPVIAVSVLPVCRRSCGFRSSSMPTALSARGHARYQLARRSGWPCGPQKSRPLLPEPAHVARWYSSSGFSSAGMGERPHPGSSLRRTERPLAALQLLVLLGDLDRPVQQIDGVAAQAHHLAETEPGEGGDKDHRPEPRLDGVGEPRTPSTPRRSAARSGPPGRRP